MKAVISMRNKDRLVKIVKNGKDFFYNLYLQIYGNGRRKKAFLQLIRNAVNENQNSGNVSWGKKHRIHFPVSRELIATAFLSGEGIEIGALHNPLAVPKTARVKYLDRMKKEELYQQYPELRAHCLVDVDIVDDGESLHAIHDNSQDFLIANHFIEHSEDPILTLTNFLRVLKAGGVLYLTVPNMQKTFDSDREETTVAHLIEDHSLGVEKSRRRHYEEWVSLIEPHFGRHYDEVAFEKRVKELMHQKYSIHYHCWKADGFKSFLAYLLNDDFLQFDVVFFIDREDEFIAILEKPRDFKLRGLRDVVELVE
jgi:SAM-dependent methyltransferase